LNATRSHFTGVANAVQCARDETSQVPVTTRTPDNQYMRFLNKAREAGDQNPVLREFRLWVRERKAARQ